MAEPLFDSHREFERLSEAGFKREQAEAIVHSLQTVLIGGVSTKADIERLESANRADIERLESANRADFERLELAIEASGKEAKADIERFELAYKADIERLELAIEASRKEAKADIGQLEARIEARIAQTATTHLKWLIGIAITLGGVIIGYLHYFAG